MEPKRSLETRPIAGITIHNILLVFTSTKLGFTSFKASFGGCFLVFWLTKIDPGEKDPGELQEGAAGRLQHLEMVQLAVSILLHITQDIAGITHFLVEVLQQLLGHFSSLAWEEGGLKRLSW